MRDNIKNIGADCIRMGKLGDLCEIVKGKTPIQKAVPGDYPLVVTSPLRRSNSTYQFDKPSVIIPLVSSRGHGVASLNQIFYQDGEFAVGNILACATPKHSTLDARYLCAYLNLKKDVLLVPLMTGGANVSLTVKTLQNANIQIPIPPLSIQQKIVSVLDAFTTLIDKMKQEVEKRKKQMEYYREKLLTFEDGECEWKTLSNVTNCITPPIKLKTSQYLERGPYFIIDQGKDYYAGYTDIETALLPDGEYILYGDHTCTVKYVDTKFAQGADGLKILKADGHNNPKYLFYAISTYNLQNTGYKRHWTQAKEIGIPIPPISRQHEIVSTLDKFESYITKLEKMIVLRQKQYEYYREQLLTFE